MLTELSRRDWPRFFSRFSAALAGRAVHVDTAGFDDELPGGSIGLVAVAYDAEHGELALVLEGGRRLVRHPLHVHLHVEDELLYSMELVDRGGGRDFMLLHKPLPVPH